MSSIATDLDLCESFFSFFSDMCGAWNVHICLLTSLFTASERLAFFRIHRSLAVVIVWVRALSSSVIAVVTLTAASLIDRHVSRGTACVRAGQWSDKKYLVGTELYGKTLAVIGLGRIGKEVALRMQAFGMTVNLPNGSTFWIVVSRESWLFLLQSMLIDFLTTL